MFQEMMPMSSGGETINPREILTSGSSAIQTNTTISGQKGKKLLVTTWYYSTSTTIAYNSKDLVVVSGGTCTVLGRMTSSSKNHAGAWQLIEVTDDSFVFNVSSGSYYAEAILLN